MAEREQQPGTELLALQALMYASGASDRVEADAFENRLAADQHAREALCRAVELVSSCSGAGAVRPDPAYRESVRRRLTVQSGVLGRLLGPRLYRGHPAAWAALGAGVAVLAMTALLGGPLSSDGRARTPEIAIHTENPGGSTGVAEAARAEEARIWARLPRSEHLLKAHSEEAQRKARADKLQRLVQMDEGRARLLAPPKN
jgi:hypothetical protein